MAYGRYVIIIIIIEPLNINLCINKIIKVNKLPLFMQIQHEIWHKIILL